MFRITFILAASAFLLHGQSAAFRWIQQIGGSGGQSLAGIATDSQGNIYVAGTTTSLDFPVQNAAQPHPGGSGLFRIDGPGSNYQNLYQAGITSTSALAIDPKNPSTIYVAAGTAIRQSKDAGVSWTTLSILQVTGIFGLVIDPTNSSILYAATIGQGVLKSVDNGVTWTPMNQGLPPAPPAGLFAHGLWIDPNHPLVLFTLGAGPNGTVLLRTADGGVSWQAVQHSPIPYLGSVTFDPFTPGKVYAGDGSLAAVSTDDGLTWTPLGKANDGYWQPSTIIPDPTHPGVLYGGSEDALWKSTDGGTTWTKVAASPAPVLAVDSSTGAIYAVIGQQTVVSTDGFQTTTPVGPAGLSASTLAAAGGHVFAGTQGGSDVFVAKLDPQGNVLFATYFGGIGNDQASGAAVDAAGAVYVTGTTLSTNFPYTQGAYATTQPGFVFKLNPDGSLAWSTGFPATPNAIAVDAAGHPYIAGITYVQIPTTPGAYQTKFNGTFCGIGCLISIPPTNGFLTEFDAAGGSLIFSTHLGDQNESATALTLLPDSSVVVAGQGTLYHLDATGSTLVASTAVLGQMLALATDPNGNILVAGATQNFSFATTSGVFQPVPYPGLLLPGTLGGYGGGDAFLMRLDAKLHTLTSTLLGGETQDVALAVAAAPNGSVILGGFTSSNAFPTRGPIQGAFSTATGFVSQLSGDFSSLAFSTYVGDNRQFSVRSIAVAPDGGILFGGYTAGLAPIPGQSLYPNDATKAFVVRVDALPPASPRIDSVVNAASQLAVPLSPGAAFVVRGVGFGADALLLMNGTAMPLLAQSSTALSFVVPTDFNAASATLTVQSGGGQASILAPGAPFWPGVFSVNGTGYGQGYILNKDGTLNSQSNPAKEGDAITICATGVGPLTFNLGYAVTDNAVNVYIGSYYANGIAAVLGPVAGLPGNVYQISVFVPHPPQPLPPQVALILQINGIYSQAGLALAVSN